MIRKNLFGKNLYYAELQDKYGFDIINVDAHKKTIYMNFRTSNIKKAFKYKNLKELNTFIQEPSIKNKFTEGYITERKPNNDNNFDHKFFN